MPRGGKPEEDMEQQGAPVRDCRLGSRTCWAQRAWCVSFAASGWVALGLPGTHVATFWEHPGAGARASSLLELYFCSPRYWVHCWLCSCCMPLLQLAATLMGPCCWGVAWTESLQHWQRVYRLFWRWQHAFHTTQAWHTWGCAGWGEGAGAAWHLGLRCRLMCWSAAAPQGLCVCSVLSCVR